MMSKRDYYEVLGVSKSATKDEIRRAIENFQKNITRILIKKQMQKKNLKKLQKRMKF